MIACRGQNVGRLCLLSMSKSKQQQAFRHESRQASDENTEQPASKRWFEDIRRSTLKGKDSTGLVAAQQSAKEIFQKEFSEYYYEGQFVNRMKYVDFIDEALHRLEELGLERNLDAYKELLKVFPVGRYGPRSSWDLGMFSAPQQMCAIRVINQMSDNKVKADAEMEEIVARRFSYNSTVWRRIAAENYWTMKGRNLDPDPLPEELPTNTDELAFVALKRMLSLHPDPRQEAVLTDSSNVPGSIDKTWITYSKSKAQLQILEDLDEKSVIYIEQWGNTYVDKNHLASFVLRYYPEPEIIKEKRALPPPDFNFNTLEMRSFGKPIKKKLQEITDQHWIDDSYILSIAMTGTSSDDSLLSWLRLLQEDYPKLEKMTVVFKIKRPTDTELSTADTPSGDQKAEANV